VADPAAKIVWSVNVTGPRAEYGGTPPLKPGTDYTWSVAALSAEGKRRGLFMCVFSVASDEQKAQAAALTKLAAGDDPVYLTLAALWFEENDLIAEATALYQRLAKLEPKCAAYHFALARLYDASDRTAEAKQALDLGHKLAPAPTGQRPAWLEQLKNR
jgi:tetratricopeptide (TPR) repeat protein